jgi:diamine N-acetyltransferase
MSLQFRVVPLKEAAMLLKFAEHSFRVAWQDHPLNAGPDFERYCQRTFTLSAFEAALKQPDAAFYWAELTEQVEPIGYIKLNWNASPQLWTPPTVHAAWAQLERIYVHPEFLGSGWGGKLLHFAHTQAQAFGFSQIWLSVWKEAPQSIRFYEKNGYRIAGEEVFWVGDDPQADWVMTRQLS